ncbi:MAG: YihY/virulence factor BrkB family protein [Acidobacteriota bacterium]
MKKKLSLWKNVVVRTWKSSGEHRSLTESAALSFYTLFSLAPVLVVVIAVASAFFGEDAVRGQVVRQFGDLMGPEQARMVQSILRRVAREHREGLAALVGGVTVLLGATALFAQLQSSLNRVWEVAPRKGHVIRTLLKKRLVSFAVLLGFGFLLLVSLALSAAIAGLQDWISRRWVISPAVLQAANIVVTFVIFTILFAMIYRILPDREIGWKDVALGAVAASIAFQIGKWGFGLYIGHTAVASPYGTAGALVVILLWVYYATSVLLLGAEFTRAHAATVLGSRPETSPGAKRVREERQEMGEPRA